MHLKHVVAIVATSFSCLGAAESIAQPMRLAHTFIAADSEPGDLFGSGVELEGNLAVIRSRAHYNSAEQDPPLPPNQTHFFRATASGAWNEVDVVTLGDTGALSGGQELALDGQEVVIGMSQGDWRDGRIDFFGPAPNSPAASEQWVARSVQPFLDPPLDREALRNNPGLLQSLRLFQRAARFGRSVDADDGFAIVGAYDTREIPSAPSGSALIYRRTANGDWRESATLTPSRPFTGSKTFGRSVALDGNVAAVVAEEHFAFGSDPPDSDVFIYERDSMNEWHEVAVLTHADYVEGGLSLTTLALSGNTLVVGDRLGVQNGIGSEGPIVYSRDDAGAWGFEADLAQATAADGIAPELLDFEVVRSIAIEEDLIAVATNAAFFDCPSCFVVREEQSRVNLYRRSVTGAWRLTDVIFAPDASTARSFGSDLAIDQGRLLIGASSNSGNPADGPGAAYLYAPVPEPATALLLIFAAASLEMVRRRSS